MESRKWSEPKPDEAYRCDDGKVRTWTELTAGLDPDSYPKDEKDYELLLWSFGADKISE
ncbi:MULTISPECIES: hypothetical protein [unclassified Collinsella]|uniref:hypothetical protein n=1 Tax=unclassified Collinsella TaxID=2637548 RepID=UPI003F914C8B